MALVDLPLDQLKVYKPEKNMEKDFDLFWQEKIKNLRSIILYRKLMHTKSFIRDIKMHLSVGIILLQKKPRAYRSS